MFDFSEKTNFQYLYSVHQKKITKMGIKSKLMNLQKTITTQSDEKMSL